MDAIAVRYSKVQEVTKTIDLAKFRKEMEEYPGHPERFDKIDIEHADFDEDSNLEMLIDYDDGTDLLVKTYQEDEWTWVPSLCDLDGAELDNEQMAKMFGSDDEASEVYDMLCYLTDYLLKETRK